jgi:hypothetical protein
MRGHTARLAPERLLRRIYKGLAAPLHPREVVVERMRDGGSQKRKR